MNRLPNASPAHNQPFEISRSVIVSLCVNTGGNIREHTSGHVIHVTMFAQSINKSKPCMAFHSGLFRTTPLVVIF